MNTTNAFHDFRILVCKGCSRPATIGRGREKIQNSFNLGPTKKKKKKCGEQNNSLSRLHPKQGTCNSVPVKTGHLSSSPENCWQNSKPTPKSGHPHGGLWSATCSCRERCFTSPASLLLTSNNIPVFFFLGCAPAPRCSARCRGSQQALAVGQHGPACLAPPEVSEEDETTYKVLWSTCAKMANLPGKL